MQRIFSTLITQPWAITSDYLQTMCEIALRENASPEAVAAQLGRPLDNTHAVTLRDGVAIIPVAGPIFRYANLFTEISGATSLEILARDFTQAMADPGVRGVLFQIDSPGGQVTGTANMAAMIAAARGQKPIAAYVEGLGASAAYWLASACDTITCEPTADLGSIGVVMAVADPTKASARDITFVSSQSPHKRPDPTTEAGRSRFQQLVDDTAAVFVSAVAVYRGLPEADVLAIEGGLLTGQRAVDAGLADRVDTFEGALAQLQTSTRSIASPLRRAARTPSDAYSARLRASFRKETP
jgi:ClpP class serine protease